MIPAPPSVDPAIDPARSSGLQPPWTISPPPENAGRHMLCSTANCASAHRQSKSATTSNALESWSRICKSLSVSWLQMAASRSIISSMIFPYRSLRARHASLTYSPPGRSRCRHPGSNASAQSVSTSSKYGDISPSGTCTNTPTLATCTSVHANTALAPRSISRGIRLRSCARILVIIPSIPKCVALSSSSCGHTPNRTHIPSGNCASSSTVSIRNRALATAAAASSDRPPISPAPAPLTPWRSSRDPSAFASLR